jgi:hypothetical protein
LSYVFLRSTTSDDFGAGDPKLFARLRLPFPRRWPVEFSVDAAARLPMADARLFPYALGAQDLEFSVAVAAAAPRWLAAGCGRILTEPPSGSAIGTSDVPHATHLWLVLSARRGRLVGALHADGLVYELQGEGRAVLGASLAHRRPRGFAAVLLADVEVGEASNRVFDYALSLRFAIALR